MAKSLICIGDVPKEGTIIPPLPENYKTMDGYELCLRMAGAKVHAFKTFGTYQGDWWAFVTRSDGLTGWVHDGYGSCSGCDAFEHQFGFTDEDSPSYPAKLAAFGDAYLSDLKTQDEAEKEASETTGWDLDADKMLAFIKAQRNLVATM